MKLNNYNMNEEEIARHKHLLNQMIPYSSARNEYLGSTGTAQYNSTTTDSRRPWQSLGGTDGHIISNSQYIMGTDPADPKVVPKEEAPSEIKLESEYTKKDAGYGHSRLYIAKIGSVNVFKTQQIAFPRCCGMTILTDVSVDPDITIPQFVEIMDLMIKDINTTDQYSKLIFYTKADSKETRFFSEYPGVVIMEKFRNRRSGNYLVGFEIDLLSYLSKDSKKTLPDWYPIDNEEDLDFDEDVVEDAISREAEVDQAFQDMRELSELTPEPSGIPGWVRRGGNPRMR